MSSVPVSGTVAPGFEPLKSLIAHSVERGEDLGSQFVVYYRGVPVIDLACGWTSPSRDAPFTADKLCVVHSTGKAVMSCLVGQTLSMEKERVGGARAGWNTKIAEVWPEFAQGGKENVTVKELLEHRAGVAWVDRAHRPSVEETNDLDKLATKIASQPHNFGGRNKRAYHAVTRGWYLNEIVRRLRGKSAGQIWLSELNPALGTEIYVGLPEGLESRLSPLHQHPSYGAFQAQVAVLPKGGAGNKKPELPPMLLSLGLSTPSGAPKGTFMSNYLPLLRAETTASFTVTNARSLARLGAVMANRGKLGSFTLMDPLTWQEAHAPESDSMNIDLVTGSGETVTWAGWGLSSPGNVVPGALSDDVNGVPVKAELPASWKGSGFQWCGWFGAGGSGLHWCNEHQLAYAFVPNLLHGGGRVYERQMRLVAAVVECVKNIEAQGAKL
ncbi:beta-lactamase/transpeptidase-like protein [Gonapodya prolifera JEL478]|uniref:Beta-lactamase/transpeptidase-like protein n=1 Tax=Gonapodya prolifera (strain JEL478) TaxID=1344416 RepID=A0A139B0P9_GONPJ|nr:beta-lactamase/transpeptidase-like protein [Gonapodya prolifera JEL478]|eukprot:KXS22520.1 beta-lactamase/transpeptidase-like protein [Gonapodya prolifera JEL478]